MHEILVPFAAADLIDRIAILQVRLETNGNDIRYGSTARQKALLDRLASRVLPDDPDLQRMGRNLYDARYDLYIIEEDLRACDDRAEFGTAFIALTRAFLASRDALDAIKSEIDDHLCKPLLARHDLSAQKALRDT